MLGASQSGGRSTLRLLRVLDHADLIDAARQLAEEAVRLDPERKVPGFADAVTQTNPSPARNGSTGPERLRDPRAIVALA